MADAAFASLFNLIVTEIRRRDENLLPKALRNGRLDELTPGKQRSALLHAYEAGGPALILSIGDGIRRVGFDPILFVLCHSKTPEILLGKWERLEAYAHSRHRTEMQLKGKELTCRRHAIRGQAPHPAENLLMCGILVALLEEIGCQGVGCELLPARRAPVKVYENGAYKVPRDLSGGFRRWRITWDDFSNLMPVSPISATLPMVVPDLPSQTPVLRQAGQLMAGDVGHCWTVKQLASEMGQSTRSLQRRFQEAGETFSGLVRVVRVREACRLLSGSDLTATQTGFWCGFTDSAHFSREFRRMTSMPPSVYRAATQAGAGLTRPG